MKIILIGPVYPYKGGISHYTSLMCRALKRNHDVIMISYKLQYPKLLFKKAQRDYKNDLLKIANTDYLINTTDPFSWFFTAKKINAQNPDLIIMQWWHPYFAPCYYAIIKNLINTKVLFLCHNVFPHERFYMDKWLTRIVLKQGNCFIVHSEQDESDLLSIVPQAKFTRAVHPTYNIFKLKNMTRREAREILNLGQDRKVLLFFGFVQKYKGLKYLIHSLPYLKDKYDDIVLLIVGEFGKDKKNYLKMIDENMVKSIISIYDGYIPDYEVEKFFAASDLIVLPYISATQSGIAQIAYDFNKPIIATDVGGLPEAVLDNKTGYIVEPKNPRAISKAVMRFFDENKADIFAANIEAEKYKYSWDKMTEILERLYFN